MTPDPDWTEAQTAFVKSLEDAGATKAEHAVAIDRALAIPARELQALVDSGVVREAAANGYYVYPRQIRLGPAATGSVGRPELSTAVRAKNASLSKTILFWIIIILIPMFMIQCLGTRGGN